MYETLRHNVMQKKTKKLSCEHHDFHVYHTLSSSSSITHVQNIFQICIKNDPLMVQQAI